MFLLFLVDDTAVVLEGVKDDSATIVGEPLGKGGGST